MRRTTIAVRAVWDPEAEVWVATSDDLPGLVTEAGTRKELVQKLHVMIPELLEARGELSEESLPEITVTITSEQREKVRLRA